MGMFQLHIKLLDNNTSLTENRLQVWGGIYVELDGYSFPDEDWNDVISSILDMWVPAIISFTHGDEGQCELYFMDGPYRLCLNWVSANEINISMRRCNKEMTANTCCILDFLESIIEGIDVFCKLCGDGNLDFISSRIFSRIDANGKKLKDMAANIKNQGDRSGVL